MLPPVPEEYPILHHRCHRNHIGVNYRIYVVLCVWYVASWLLGVPTQQVGIVYSHFHFCIMYVFDVHEISAKHVCM